MTEEMVRRYTVVVEFLGRVLGPDYEVTLYDLEMDACPVIAIANGRINGQTIGSPLPEVAKALIDRREYAQSDYIPRFTSYLASGKAVRSSAMFIKDGEGRPVGLLGINFDDSRYVSLCGALLEMLHPAAYVREQYVGDQVPTVPIELPAGRGSLPIPEAIHNDVPSLIEEIFAETLATWAIAPERLTQEERIAVIAQLKSRGMFRLKGSVQYAAENLGCSQASIYRYLSKVRQEAGTGEDTLE